MAEGRGGDKTEKATPHKLRQARKQGQVPRSRDLAAALGLLLALKLAFWMMPQWLDEFRELFALAFAPLSGSGALDNSWSKLFAGTLLLLVNARHEPVEFVLPPPPGATQWKLLLDTSGKAEAYASGSTWLPARTLLLFRARSAQAGGEAD